MEYNIVIERLRGSDMVRPLSFNWLSKLYGTDRAIKAIEESSRIGESRISQRSRYEVYVIRK